MILSDPHTQPTPLTRHIDCDQPRRRSSVTSRLGSCSCGTKPRHASKGSEMELELDDVWDHHHPDEQAALQASLSSFPAPKLARPPTPQRATSRAVLFDAAVDLEGGGAGGSWDGSRGRDEPVYAGVGETSSLGSTATSVDGRQSLWAFPIEEHSPGQYPPYTVTSAVDVSDLDYEPSATPRRPRPSHLRRQSSAASRRSRASVHEHKFFWALPHAVRKPLWAWWDRVMSVLSPEWLRTTLLVWGACWSMSLAYTMFNAFLPKLLETRTTLEPELSSASPKRLEDSLWDVVIFTIGGCPGAILGAYLIKSHPG
ncbi:hypothetical protein BKA70DRAFT_129607 [Coprinopsis sp. MPI-PUGE-AT-0042]|nr:hypothetical protein BKA70DRAFT_129607 [Coprinopsis sp. MPI-PUGE-AT-0042]